MLEGLFKSMRPKQWAKNVLIFVPLLFDEKLFRLVPLLRSLAAFALFCLFSSAVYLVNDLEDIERDRTHPVKRLRPLPSGQLSTRVARVAAIMIPLVCLPLSWWLDPCFAGIAFVYLVLNIAYTFYLKHLVILDVMIIATFYVLRVAGGAIAVHVERFSPWLYIFTTLGALFISLSKRRHELLLLKENANEHRASLEEYTVRFLDELTGMVASGAIMAYSLYTFSSPNLPANHTMMLTIPCAIYGIFRYLYLVHVKQMGGAPEEVILKDIPLLVDGIVWALLAFLVLYVQ